MTRWIALALVAAFVLAGVAVFFLYDMLVPSSPVGETAGTSSELNSGPEATKPAGSPATPDVNRPKAGPGWALSCKSQATETEFQCRMSQTVVMKPSGQVLASVTFQIPAETKRPEILIQLPLGSYIPSGATYQVDGGAIQTLSFKACDLKGCYAQMAVTPEILASLRSGEKLILGFQTLAQKPIKIALSLGGFGETFDKIQGRS